MFKFFRPLLGTSLACILLVAPGSAFPQEESKPADNSKVNKRDREKSAVTADQQKMNSSDQEITKNIRKAIVSDKSLSTYAHNIKVITQNGIVTLKGPVRSADEKKNLVAKATTFVSADKIDNQISIAQ